MLSTKVQTKKKKIISVSEIILLLFALVFSYPFILMLIVSVKTGSEAILSPITFPKEFNFVNFLIVFEKMNFLRTFSNSLIVTSFSVLGIILLAGMAAFVIAKSKHKILRNFYFFFLLGMLIPFHTTMVPLTVIMKNLGLLNSIPGICLAYIGKALPFAIFLFTGFIREISPSIIEAAIIDGAPKWKVYWKVIFPMLKPITATVIVIDVLWFWNDFLLPLLVFAKRQLHTIPLTQFNFNNQLSTQWELSFASYVIAAIPVLIIFVTMQNYVISGMTQGAVKG